MYLDFEFEELDNSFELEFEQVTEVSDGGFELGYEEAQKEIEPEVDLQGDLLEQVATALETKVSGYERGKKEGFAEALDKRTDLVATANGEYTPSDDSTGFKSVSVNVADKRLIEYINGTLTEVKAEDFQGISELLDYIFYGSPSLKRVEFAEDLWNLGHNAFDKCEKLETVDFRKCTRVRYLGYSTFQECTSLREITIPSTVETIGSSVFLDCSSLSSVTFAENSIMKSISMAAFRGCTSLKEITIPPNVNDMTTYAFRDCTSLKLFKLKPKTPPKIQSNTFQNVPNDCVYMVDYGCGEAYRSATNWSALADKIVEGDV